jgi:hypothetical protein
MSVRVQFGRGRDGPPLAVAVPAAAACRSWRSGHRAATPSRAGLHVLVVPAGSDRVPRRAVRDRTDRRPSRRSSMPSRAQIRVTRGRERMTGRSPEGGKAILPLVPHLRAYARGLTGGDVHTADDLVQDTLVQALRLSSPAIVAASPGARSDSRSSCDPWRGVRARAFCLQEPEPCPRAHRYRRQSRRPRSRSARVGRRGGRRRPPGTTDQRCGAPRPPASPVRYPRGCVAPR